MSACCKPIAAAFLTLMLAGAAAWAEPPIPPRDDRQDIFLTDIPAYRGNVILGRPTDCSITLSILLRDRSNVKVAYGRQGEGLTLHTDAVELQAGEPRAIVLDGLAAGAAYEYRIINAQTGEVLLPEAANGAFHTGRAAGESFTFTIQADSHLDGQCLPQLYHRTLANELAAKPDFIIDLGDTFMTGKQKSRDASQLLYAAQRYYFGLIGMDAPVFLVLGNHDGEEADRPGAAAAEGRAVWACLQRKRFFPNPVPGEFYTGNAEPQQYTGPLEDYYSFVWGDALFLALDPYWTSGSTRGGKEPWNMTIGKKQYDWLARTLRSSKAQYKFVFIHQLAGGLDRSGRGGAEAAGLYEWGGHEKDGANTFAQHRPDWEKPIHSLLVETCVSAVFHGHDHFFARQAVDGIVYQLVPQPAHRNSRDHHAQEYGYVQGDFLPSSGHLRVSVTPNLATVAYIRSVQTEEMQGSIKNGEVAYSYTLAPHSAARHNK